jgi:hypothetical protein
MPRLRLNHNAAKRIGGLYGLHTAEQTAEFLGLDVEHVRDVCERGGHPSDKFIAAVLSKCATNFEELFDVEVTGAFDVPVRPGERDPEFH